MLNLWTKKIRANLEVWGYVSDWIQSNQWVPAQAAQREVPTSLPILDPFGGSLCRVIFKSRSNHLLRPVRILIYSLEPGRYMVQKLFFFYFLTILEFFFQLSKISDSLEMIRGRDKWVYMQEFDINLKSSTI